MAKEEKTYMPAGMGGLMRFGEEEEPLVKIQPKHVVYVIAATVSVLVVARVAIHLF